MSNTRAKFRCIEVSKRLGWGENPIMYAAKLTVVCGDNPENKIFFAATPGGSIEMTTIKHDHFEVGKEYYVDFTVAE